MYLGTTQDELGQTRSQFEGVYVYPAINDIDPQMLPKGVDIELKDMDGGRLTVYLSNSLARVLFNKLKMCIDKEADEVEMMDG